MEIQILATHCLKRIAPSLKRIAILIFLLSQVLIFQSAFSFEVTAPKTQIPVNEILVLKDPTGKLQFSDLNNPTVAEQFRKIETKW